MPLNLFKPSDDTSLSALHGRNVLITGGASGLGASTARYLAEHGAYITIADLKDSGDLATTLGNAGCKMQFVRCDITSYDSQIAAFESAVAFSTEGELDAVLAFAGVDNAGPLVDHVVSTAGIPPAPSTSAIDVNVKGTLYTTTLALHYLRPSHSTSPTSRDKSLLLVASMAGYADDPHNTSYSASKFGLRGLFRSLRSAAHDQLGIRVNTLNPWGMYTPMTAPILDHLATMGIHPGAGKGITLVPHEVLVKAAARVLVDESVRGRAVAIVPEGAVDLGDDLAGGYAGEQVREIMRLRGEAGDFIKE